LKLKIILKYIFSGCAIALLSISVIAQEMRYVPTGIRIGTDLSLLGISAFSSNRSGYEINGDIDFDKFFLVWDIGHEYRDRISPLFHYNSEGDYFRIGLDVNLINPHKNQNNNVMFLGFRIAKAFYDDRVSFSIIDNNYGVVDPFRRNFELVANWLELTAGIKVRMWRNLYLGYTGRLKFSKDLKGDESLRPFDIPGYGKSGERSLFGINYYITYLIRWKDKPLPPEKDRD